MWCLWGWPDTLLGPEGTGTRWVSWGCRRKLVGLGRCGGVAAFSGPHAEPDDVGGGVWVCPLLENCTVDASIFVSEAFCLLHHVVWQVFKGTRWMPWHQEPKKDVGACDKPRGVGNRTLIRGFPNGETRLESCPVTRI